MRSKSKSLLLPLFLALSALAQQPQLTPQQALDEYRAKMAPILRDDFGGLARYRDANAALRPPAAGENRVVFFGDSITDAWKIDEYFPGKPYINRGIGGQTTPQMLLRFRQDVVDLEPKAVVILAGTNDIAGNTGPERIEDIEANYASMAEIADANHIRVIFSSVTPVHNYTALSQNMYAFRSPARILELNGWLKNYVAGHPNCFYLDYFSAMVDDKGLLKKDLAEDGLHPNPAGYKIMAPLAEAAIEKALGKGGPSSQSKHQMPGWLPAHMRDDSQPIPQQLMISDAPKTARTLDAFKSLRADMTMVDVVRRCGIPDEHHGSGIYIFTYLLDDGSIVAIGTGDLKSLLYVQHGTFATQVESLLENPKK